MTRYRITRYDSSVVDCRVLEDGKIPYQLPHIPAHSPTGFNCGYFGSGPADLALALLVHHLGEDPKQVYEKFQTESGCNGSEALRLHQRFKQDIVANVFLADGESYILTDEQIGHWMLEGL